MKYKIQRLHLNNRDAFEVSKTITLVCFELASLNMVCSSKHTLLSLLVDKELRAQTAVW